MFIGHFGVAFAAQKAAPKPSLGTLFIAAQFIDLLWPFFLILGLEKVKISPGITNVTPLDFVHYPFSHSLAGVIFWAVLFGGFYYFLRKDKRTSIVLGILVLSHWVLDLLVHRPDLPVLPGVDLFVGFNLWNSYIATILLEGIIFATGIYFYVKNTSAKNKTGNFSLWGIVIFLLAVYLMNLFGPLPQSEEPIGYIGLSQWLLVAWAYWIDRNRNNR